MTTSDARIVVTDLDAEGTFGGRVMRGAVWSFLNSTVLRLSQFLVGIVIARMVAPDIVGVFVVATTVFTVIVNFSDLGVTSALVRDINHADRLAPTVNTIAISTNAAFALLTILAAPQLARLLGAPSATTAIQILALSVLLAGCSSVPGALLTGTFRQKQRLFADLAFFLSANGYLIVALALGGGVISLAISRVIGQLVSTVALLIMSPRRYGFGFDREAARELFRFGLPLSGASLVGLLIGNTDFAVVSRVSGTTSLGYYNLAYNISGWPVGVFTSVAVNVALPALTRVKESPAMLARYFTIVLSALASSALPVGVLILALSDPLVRTVYGDRWAPAAPALAALAVFGINRVFIALLSDMLVVYGRTALFLKLQILWLVLLVPALVVLVHLAGTIGAGLAHILVAFPIMTPIFVMAVRKHGDWLTVRLLLKAAFPPLAASVLAGVVASFVAGQIHTPWLALIVGGFAGTLTYVVLLGRWLISTVRGFRAILSTDPSEASSDDDSVGPSHTERAQAASREAPGPGIAGTGSTVTEDGQPGEGRP